MSLQILPTDIPEVVVIQPHVFGDARGFFLETYNRQKYTENGIACTFVQDNHSLSAQGTLRGLHYQLPYSQAKLVSVVKGAVLDVAVDIRRGSPSFGKWVAEILSEENKRQLFIPRGFAHGFCVLSDQAHFMYKCDEFYHPEADRGINWADPTIRIDWQIDKPLLSEKDAAQPFLRDIPEAHLPAYKPAGIL